MHKEALDHLIRKIETVEGYDDPFTFVSLSGLFPQSYAEQLREKLPEKHYFAPLMHKDAMTGEGQSTRGELYLEEDKLASLPQDIKDFWLGVGNIMRSDALRSALTAKLGVDPAIRAKPLLYRDESGYKIRPHTDISTKAITMQIYLPPDDRWKKYGTTFYRQKGEQFEQYTTMPFVPNQGYAFAVSDKSWHGVEEITENGVVRASLMVIFYKNEFLTDDGQLNFVDPNVARKLN